MLRCIHTRVISNNLGLKFCYSKIRASCLSIWAYEKVFCLCNLRASEEPKGGGLSQSQTLYHFWRSERTHLLGTREWAALFNFLSKLFLHAEVVFGAGKFFVEHPHYRKEHL